jgi:hypothetical protein
VLGGDVVRVELSHFPEVGADETDDIVVEFHAAVGEDGGTVQVVGVVDSQSIVVVQSTSFATSLEISTPAMQDLVTRGTTATVYVYTTDGVFEDELPHFEFGLFASDPVLVSFYPTVVGIRGGDLLTLVFINVLEPIPLSDIAGTLHDVHNVLIEVRNPP